MGVLGPIAFSVAGFSSAVADTTGFVSFSPAARVCLENVSTDPAIECRGAIKSDTVSYIYDDYIRVLPIRQETGMPFQ